MTVRVVQKPYHRLRCVSCLKRVGDTEGPFFDFGEFPEALAEKIGEDRLNGKTQTHGDVLVCASCLRKAHQSIPEDRNRVAVLEARLSRAVEERDEWREVALADRDLGEKIAEILDRRFVVPSGTPAASEEIQEPIEEQPADVQVQESVSVETPEVHDDRSEKEKAAEAAFLSGQAKTAPPGRPADGEPDKDDPNRSPLWDLTVKEIKKRYREQGVEIPAGLDKKAELIGWLTAREDDPEVETPKADDVADEEADR